MKKNEKQAGLASALDEYEESCVYLRGFAALLDRDSEIYDESRDEVSALLSRLIRNHAESAKKLVAIIDSQR